MVCGEDRRCFSFVVVICFVLFTHWFGCEVEV